MKEPAKERWLPKNRTPGTKPDNQDFVRMLSGMAAKVCLLAFACASFPPSCVAAEVQRLTHEWLNQQRQLPQTTYVLPLDAGWTIGPGEAAAAASIAIIEPLDVPCLLTHAVDFDAEQFNVFRLRMKASAGAECIFTWRSDIEPAFDTNPGITLPITADDAPHDYLFSLTSLEADAWAGHIQGIRITPADKAARVEILSCVFAHEAPEGPRRVTIQEQTREALFGTRPPWRTLIPPNALFEVGIGMLERSAKTLNTDGARFVVTLEADGQQKILVDETLTPSTVEDHRQWRTVQADVSSYAGQNVSVAFSVEPGKSVTGDYAYWGAPTVFSRSANSNDIPIVLISCDTVRADHVSCYGYGRPTTPYLDEWSREAALFEQAITTSTWTTPSHISMITGLAEATHIVAVLEESRITLPKVLADAGYLTAGFTGFGATLQARTGMAHGFDVYDLPPEKFRGARETLELIKHWLDDHATRRFFLFFHNFDAHMCADRKPNHHSLYGPMDTSSMHYTNALPEPDRLASEMERWRDASGSGKILTDMIDETVVQYGIAGYDDAILSVDSVLFDLFNDLKKRGLYDQALIIVTADHGEEFGEHGRYAHHTAYEECCRVPLIIKFPHQAFAGMRCSRMVQLVDLLPTVLEVAHLPVTPQIDGQSLIGALKQEAMPHNLASIRSLKQWALRSNDRKVVADHDNSNLQFFNLAEDPRERQDRASDHGIILGEIGQELAKMITNTGWSIRLWPGPTKQPLHMAVRTPEPMVSAADLNGVPIVLTSPRELVQDITLDKPLYFFLKPDPLNPTLTISLSSETEFAIILGTDPPVSAKQVEQELDLRERAYSHSASAPTGPFERPTILISYGPSKPQTPQAGKMSEQEIQALQAAGYLDAKTTAPPIRASPITHDLEVLTLLEVVLRKAGDYRAAAIMIWKMVAVFDDDAESRETLHASAAGGLTAPDSETAYLSACRAAAAVLAGNADDQRIAAQLAEKQGDLEAAIRALQRAAALAPKSVEVQLALAVVLEKQGMALLEMEAWEDAAHAFRKVAELRPDYFGANNGLARALEKQGDAAGALEAFRKAHTLAPENIVVAMDVARVLEANGRIEEAIAAYREVIQRRPTDSNAYLRLGQILGKKKDYEGAIAALKEAQTLDPRNEGVFTAEGLLQLEHGNVQRATDVLRKATELDPRDANAWNLLSESLRRQRAYPKALDAALKYLAISPQDAFAYINTGRLREELGDLDGAIADYQKAQEIAPQEPRIAPLLANALRKKPTS